MIAIIDYQMGNLRSVQKGFERVGHEAVVTSDAAQLADADKIVLPGVGAFEDAIRELQDRNLVEPIRSAVADGRPVLGICLGMQLFFERSFENGEHVGLGLIPGDVVQFDLPSEYKVPHMGWNQIEVQQSTPLLEGIASGTHFYFVHSFHVVSKDTQAIAATTDYGSPFCSIVARDNLFATQFHPEKSQEFGLQILRNFAERCS